MQFSLVGRVLSVADDIHPWTTDPENPDRPEAATTTRWVTFEVERWYLSDWGLIFSVWMRDIATLPGQRVGCTTSTGVGFIEASLDSQEHFDRRRSWWSAAHCDFEEAPR